METMTYAQRTGMALRRLRESQGLSLPAAAEKAGLAHQTITAWEHARRNPKVEDLARYVELLGANLRDVLPPDPGDTRRIRQLASQAADRAAGELCEVIGITQAAAVVLLSQALPGGDPA